MGNRIGRATILGVVGVGLLLLTVELADGGRGGRGGGGGRAGGGARGGGGGRAGGASRPSGGVSRPSGGGVSRPSVNRSPSVSAPRANRPSTQPKIGGGGAKIAG